MVQRATLPLMLKQLNLPSFARHWQGLLEGWTALWESQATMRARQFAAPDPPATDDAEDSEIDFFSEEPAPLPIIECPGCGKKYVWKPEHAGVAAPCRCGATVRMPLEEPAPPGAEAADLNYNENEKETLMSKTSAKGGFICDGCGNMLPPNRMVCPQCGFDNEED